MTKKALVVDHNLSRWGEKTRVSAEQVWTKISGQDTGGAWSAFESLVPARYGVPLHQHHSQDEWFWILEGDFVFEVGGEDFRLSQGMSLLAPRKVAHRWSNCTENAGRTSDPGAACRQTGSFLRPNCAIACRGAAKHDHDEPRI